MLGDHQVVVRYDAAIFGTPTRFGNMAAQMRNFMDQTEPLWGRGALVGKAGSEARMPTKLELEMCRYQGEHVTRITSQLVAGARRQ